MYSETVKTSTSVLNSEAGQLDDIYKSVVADFQAFYLELQNTCASWSGEAFNTEKQHFDTISRNMDLFAVAMQNKSENLFRISNIYQKAENDNFGRSSSVKLDKDFLGN